MNDSGQDLAWKLFVELRKEILESQRIRAQIIGFKITFVSTAIAVIVAYLQQIPGQLLVIPAFAAMFFDLLISSYSISIKRIGHYLGRHVEPGIRQQERWPEEQPLWEEYMGRPKPKQWLALIGNLGITSLATLPAVWGLFNPFEAALSIPLLVCLILLGAYDVLVYLRPGRYV